MRRGASGDQTSPHPGRGEPWPWGPPLGSGPWAYSPSCQRDGSCLSTAFGTGCILEAPTACFGLTLSSHSGHCRWPPFQSLPSVPRGSVNRGLRKGQPTALPGPVASCTSPPAPRPPALASMSLEGLRGTRRRGIPVDAGTLPAGSCAPVSPTAWGSAHKGVLPAVTHQSLQ